MIFNLGAPSHVDLWDMKPDAPREIRGPFKPIRTKSPDIDISEILPMHAKIADKFSLVRTVHHGGAAVHDAGWQIMQTGRRFTGGIQTPHAGAVASYLLGRKSDLINVGGQKVYPAEVESVLVEHPRVVEAACAGRPDPRKGQIIVAHVVLEGPEPQGLLDDLRKLVGDRVGWHAAPRELRVHDALPRTESGKVRRKELRELDPPEASE